MDCHEARELLLDRERGRLAPEERARVEEHLAGCEACRRAAAADGELSRLLDQLPQYAAPLALKRRLAARLAASPSPSAPPSRSRGARMLRQFAAPLAAGLLSAALVVLALRGFAPPRAPSGELVDEAVNDHLRVVQSTHPVEIESGGLHQVKPWFTGRLDFAPRVTFSGDDDFPLTGGSVVYFRDRKAAVFVFKRRLHTVSLFVFPSEGLPWPAPDRELGRLHVATRDARGFNVLLWRDRDLGYALVSDVSRPDLELLAARIEP
jgi:anti-sigma factor RsiW